MFNNLFFHNALICKNLIFLNFLMVKKRLIDALTLSTLNFKLETKNFNRSNRNISFF